MNLVNPIRAGARQLIFLLSVLGLGCATAWANDEVYPSRPIRFIVPYAPGGTTDLIARLYAEQLGRRLGQSVVVDNRPGAGTNIAGQALAAAEPNGYTLMLGTNQAIVNAVFGPKPPFDPVNGFAPVGLVAEVPFALAVEARSPAQGAKELLASLTGKRELTVAHAQFDAQLKLLSQALAVPVLGIPYQGAAQAMTAVLSGEVPAVMSAVSALAPQVKAGKLRIVGIASSKRISAFPDRPTFVEQGYPEFVTSGWISVLAPRGTSDLVLRRLSEVTLAIVKDPAFIERIRASGAEPLEGGAAAMSARMTAEHALWAKVVR